MGNLLENHELDWAYETEAHMSLIQDTLGELRQEDRQSFQSMKLATFSLNKDYADPFFQLVAGGYLYSPDDLARSAIQHGIQIIRYAYETVGVSGSFATTAAGKPAALLALGFPTDENGWPCTPEDPLINAVLLAPPSRPGSFESAIRAENLASRFGVGPAPLRRVEWRETDSSEAGIRLAVDHLLRFNRTHPAKTFAEDVRSVFAVEV